MLTNSACGSENSSVDGSAIAGSQNPGQWPVELGLYVGVVCSFAWLLTEASRGRLSDQLWSACIPLWTSVVEARVLLPVTSSQPLSIKLILKSGYQDIRVSTGWIYFPGLGFRRYTVRDVEKAVLQLLVDSDLELTPSNIARNTGYSGGYVRKECNRLAEVGLLEKENAGSNPFYSITGRGRAYLGGELTDQELEE